ncbi:MAG: DNA repair protein RecN [Gammaproteobacteria bacterium]|jgi:DNA repair protein RecN (Recombination protein N)
MLVNITIKNFAIIDQLNLDLSNGITVLTGETGAGKSIIVDAVELALGARASVDMIRHGTDRADISISFDLAENLRVQNCLRELELDHADECIIRRTISKDGRSKSFVNDIPTTLQSLRNITENLISIHGQHEFHTLLKREIQRSLLDNFAGHSNLIHKVKEMFFVWQGYKNEYEQVQQSSVDATARAEFLNYQIKELAELELKENEIELLHQEHKKLANADELLNNCQMVLALLSEGNEINVLELLHQANFSLEKIKNIAPQIQDASKLLDGAVVEVEESINEIKHYLDSVELNPERLQEVESRLAKIEDVARKHRVKAENLVELYEKMQQEFMTLENKDKLLEGLQEKIIKAEQEYFAFANKLSASRKKYAKKLSCLVTENMQRLGMRGGKFAIEFEDLSAKPTSSGCEAITFMVSANPGQPLSLLSKVASGGELSRISLAIQVVTAQKSATPVLIFDEVDVGIGGATAEIVGKLLRKLGDSTQAICITHQAQVAAFAHSHLLVGKESHANATKVTVGYLDEQGKIKELARMIGGVKITEQALAHAKEMLF